MNKCCALTGHRDLPPDFDGGALFDALEALIREGYDSFQCGMATGFDLLALDCLAALKRKYPIFLEACVPYAGQERKFPAAEREKYRKLLPWCDKVTVLSSVYYKGCFLARDRYMVEGCDLLFAYCTKETGGAAYTVEYAVKKGIKVRYFPDPPEE